jgi:hypothetical protein
MLVVDKDEGRKDVVQIKKGPIRSVPTIAPEFTNAAIANIKEEQLEKAMCEAAPKGDEQLVALADRYARRAAGFGGSWQNRPGCSYSGNAKTDSNLKHSHY